MTNLQRMYWHRMTWCQWLGELWSGSREQRRSKRYHRRRRAFILDAHSRG